MRKGFRIKMTMLTMAFCGVLSVLCTGKAAFAQDKEFKVTFDALTVSEHGVLTGYSGNKETVEEIVLPENVTAIGEGVFQGFPKLKTIVLSEKVTSFGKDTFRDSGISTMAVYDQMKEDGTVTVTDYKEGVVTLPKSLQTIDATTFYDAKGIVSFAVQDGNTAFSVASSTDAQSNEQLLSADGTKLYRFAQGFNNSGQGVRSIVSGIRTIMPYAMAGVTVNGTFTLPNTVERIENYGFYGCGNLVELAFEPTAKVSYFGDYAFAYNENLSNIGQVVLPESLTTVGKYCFENCYNMNIDMSKTSIVSIPEFLFQGCRNQHELVLPKTLKYIEAYAFYECDNFNKITFLSDTLEKIGTAAFKGCQNLHEIEVPNGVINIENDTFDGCQNLNKIILPDSVEKIGDNAFKDCQNIHEMVIPENVKYISNSSFTGANQDGIDTSKNEYAQSILGALPKKGDTFVVAGLKYKVIKSAKTNGTVAVCGVTSKKLTKAVIPDKVKRAGYDFKVTEISKNAFKKCKKLKSITIGKNVTKIGSGAFNGDKKLSKIVIKSTNLKSVGKNAVKGISKKATIKVPKKKMSKYKKLFKGRTGFKKTMKIKKA